MRPTLGAWLSQGDESRFTKQTGRKHDAEAKDGSPEASEGPYWSEELLAVLVVGLGDETQARDTLEGIIQQALSGKALQGLSEEAC